MNNENTEDTEDTGRPLGAWLRIVDALLTREFAVAFEGEGVTRRDWMLLNALAGGGAPTGFAERLVRRGKKLRSLEDRGWVAEGGDGTWTLTDEGRAARARLGEIVEGIRSRVASTVSPDDFATTMASLEAIARELGWEEGMPLPRRGRRAGRGFGPRFGRGFRPGFGPGFRPGLDGPDHDHDGFGGPGGPCHGHGHGYGHGHHGHGHHGHPRGERRAERAYERGFDAGFARGRGAPGA